MDNKRHLKKFTSQNDYELQKDSVMGIPHVVLIGDTKELFFIPKITEVDYSKQYFTLHMLSDGDMKLYKPLSYTSGSLAYSVNGGEWITFNSDTTLTLVTDDEVKVKCIANAYTRGSNNTMFDGTCDYEVYGNAMSLLYGDDFEGQSVLTTQYSFRALFYNQKTLKNAEKLILPATTLADRCYSNMFYGCSSLTTTPELPATTLAERCYGSMFSYCTSLTTTLELPATTLANSCYEHMFYKCTSLTSTPQLPATTLANSCYSSMFNDCTSLTTTPELLATTLASSCYNSMFRGCTSLTEAPELPATTLANLCYASMFQNCSNLTTAPQLLATTLENDCYNFMFYDCSKLNKITMLATDISAYNCLFEWVSGVALGGTFVTSGIEIPSGVNGIPIGWTVENYSA